MRSEVFNTWGPEYRWGPVGPLMDPNHKNRFWRFLEASYRFIRENNLLRMKFTPNLGKYRPYAPQFWSFRTCFDDDIPTYNIMKNRGLT